MQENMKILIAYDGSACADSALDDLKRAGLPPKVDALILSMAEVWLPPPPPSSYEIVEEARDVHVPADMKKVYARGTKAVEEACELAEKAGARLRAVFPEWNVTTEGSYGSPAWEIILKSDAWKPDLIIVGSHGRSALGRFVIGSVSQKVVTEAHSSVRVARGRVDVEGSNLRVIVGVDGSAESKVAVEAVAQRSWPLLTEFRVIVVDDPLVPTTIGRLIPPVAKWIEESNEEDMTWVRQIADDAAKTLREAGLIAIGEVREGEPKRVLVDEAEEWHADAIFVGSTGSGGRIKRFMLGSVSAAVVARAGCSVEVVRARRVD